MGAKNLKLENLEGVLSKLRGELEGRGRKSISEDSRVLEGSVSKVEIQLGEYSSMFWGDASEKSPV